MRVTILAPALNMDRGMWTVSSGCVAWAGSARGRAFAAGGCCACASGGCCARAGGGCCARAGGGWVCAGGAWVHAGGGWVRAAGVRVRATGGWTGAGHVLLDPCCCRRVAGHALDTCWTRAGGGWTRSGGGWTSAPNTLRMKAQTELDREPDFGTVGAWLGS
jgi:hypothetical protein